MDTFETFKAGDKLRLRVVEPRKHRDNSTRYPGNYIPVDYVGSVDSVSPRGASFELGIRWHLPASFGYDTVAGTPSSLLHINQGVYLETRKRARNVVISSIDKITEEEFKRFVIEASTK